MLNIGRLGEEEWNEKIFPLIKNVVLKERTDLRPKVFLMIYKLVDAVIEDKDGKLYK